MDQRKTIVVLAGASGIADEMSALYASSLAECDVHVVREETPLRAKLAEFVRRRLASHGLLSVIDGLVLRGWQLIAERLSPATAARQGPIPNLVVPSINDPKVTEYIASVAPSTVVLNICSLLRAETLARIACPVLNVHNGINPRYRGAGNIWALHEDNIDWVGVTVHRVDAGIDTGERLGVMPLDPIRAKLGFGEVDREAFLAGGRMVVAAIRGEQLTVPDRFGRTIDRFYPFPGLTAWLRARRNYSRRVRRGAADEVESRWHAVFQRNSADSTKSVGQRMLWADDSTLRARDELVIGLLRERGLTDRQVLDVGCGDGRYAQWVGAGYVGCDYAEGILALGNMPSGRFVVADARQLPFDDGSFDAVLGIGLFQHMDSVQRAADEMARVLRPGGWAIFNTLRQPSLVELAAFALAPPWSAEKLRVAFAVARGEHSPELNIARRYSARALARLFGARGGAVVVRYNGILGTRLLAREVTVAIQRRATARERKAEAASHGTSA